MLALAPGGRVMVRGDAERLAQVAHNLVRNSLAHTPAGTTVTVVTGTDKGMGLIQVSDDGPGIAAQHLHRVFDRFFQGDPSRAGSGTGLGLAIVRAIAEALGGTASASRAAEGGACMTVRIPLAFVGLENGNGGGVSEAAPSLRAPGSPAPSPA